MRKWFIAAVNILLASLVLLIWALKTKQGTDNYNTVMAQYVPKILLSFTVLTFLILLYTVSKNRNRP